MFASVQNGADLTHKHAWRDRLSETPRRAQFERELAELIRKRMVHEHVAGDRDQRHARGAGVDQLDGVEPADARHEHVDHHHIEPRARECFDSLRTILGRRHTKS
jgi:hypothetical protein